jgi:hypothetical protein
MTSALETHLVELRANRSSGAELDANYLRVKADTFDWKS